MHRRSFLATVISLSLGGAFLAGCGSGGGGSASGGSIATRSVQGTVNLPAGFPLTPDALRVETSFNGQAVPKAGAFTASVGAATDQPTLGWARTANSIVLFGFLGTASGAETIDVRSTALALLYFGLGGYMLPSTNTATLLGLLGAHAALGPLTDTLTRRLTADPTSLMKGDTEVGNALNTAVNAVLADRPTPSRAKSATSTSAATRAKDAASPALVLLDPSAAQSNVEVLQGDAAQTILATNHARRYCQVRLYEIGYSDAQGVRTDYPKAKLVGGNLYSLSSTSALGISSTIFGFFSGATAFVPVSTPAIPLTMESGASQTFYETVVLGSSTLQSEPGFFTASRYVDELASWRSSVQNLNMISWFFDIIFGILLEVWGLRNLAISQDSIQVAVATLRTLEIANWLQIVEAAENGDFSGATTAFWKLFAANSDFVKSLQSILAALSPQIRAIIGKEASAASLQLVTAAISTAFGAVSAVLGAGDLGAVLWDLAHAQRADIWTTTLFQPTLTLSPATATIGLGQRVTLAVKIPTGIQGTVVYDWKQTGTYATLSSSDGVVGNSIETSSNTVDLVTTPSDQGKITVTVTVYTKDASGAKTLIGRAQSVVTLDPNTMVVTPGIKIVAKTSPSGAVVQYGFFTVSVVPNALTYDLQTNYLSDNYLYKQQYDAGAPVLDTDRDMTSAGTPYGSDSSWFNLGNSVIGCYSSPTYTELHDASQEQHFHDLVMSIMQSANAKVVIKTA